MQPLAARDLIQIWEWGEERHPVDRALALLILACPERTWEDLVTLTIGQRDALLLALRELTFGPQMDSFVTCPECGEYLEFSINIVELLNADSRDPVETEQTFELETLKVRFRLPNSLDLAAAARCDDVSAARDLLVHRCVLQAGQGVTDAPETQLPEATVTALATHMAECDPLAEVRFDLHCAECGHVWPALLDIVSFFWAEIADQAKRLLRDIHTLAWAYGWRESDILNLSARRRQIYMEMVNG
jgi:hypothetical protein